MITSTQTTKLIAAVAVLLLTAGTAAQVQAYTNSEITDATTQAYNIAKNARVGTFVIETCTNQLTAGDLSHIDACMNFVRTFDKYLSLALSESNSDVQQITGYSSGLN